jgi:hypothetical protein
VRFGGLCVVFEDGGAQVTQQLLVIVPVAYRVVLIRDWLPGMVGAAATIGASQATFEDSHGPRWTR